MPRKKQTIHASGLVEVKATVGNGLDGKRIQKSFYGTSKLDAQKKADKYKLSQEVASRTGDTFIKKDYTFGAWAKKWLETYKKPSVSENTYRLTYENTVNKHLIPFFGKARLTDIKPIDVQKFFEGKTSYSETMLDKMQMCLTAIFGTAIDNDICYKNPVKNISYKSQAFKHEKQIYTSKQMETAKELALPSCPEVVILLETGLRRGELLGLQWGDIDLKQRTIKVQRSIAGSYIHRISVNPPKWNSFRIIVLRKDDMSIKLLETMPQTSEWIFLNKNFQPHVPDLWSRRLDKFMANIAVPAGLPALTAHELRHTYGTDLRRQGVDIYTIQKLMGHKDVKMTSELYVHNEIEELKKALKI